MRQATLSPAAAAPCLDPTAESVIVCGSVITDEASRGCYQETGRIVKRERNEVPENAALDGWLKV